jgi:glycosyltransferase involved in cell wall biosynthesis
MLAIIIPYYKLDFFEATLQSLANQTDKRFNVYIGDDASTEDCSGLLNKFSGKFNFNYHRFDTNLGGENLTGQWERCIGLIGEEEWIMLLGDDDVLSDNVVECFYNNSDSYKAAGSNVVRYASKVINSNGEEYLGPFLHPELESASDFYQKKVKGLTRSSLSEYVFKRDIVNKYHFTGYPLAWHSDDKACLDFSENKPIFSINEAIVFVRFSEVNISGRKDNTELKLKATNLFFRDIINRKSTVFGKNQIVQLLLKYEEIVKKERKLTLNEWKFLSFSYLSNFNFLAFLKFIRRFFISFLKS